MTASSNSRTGSPDSGHPVCRFCRAAPCPRFFNKIKQCRRVDTVPQTRSQLSGVRQTCIETSPASASNRFTISCSRLTVNHFCERLADSSSARIFLGPLEGHLRATCHVHAAVFLVLRSEGRLRRLQAWSERLSPTATQHPSRSRTLPRTSHRPPVLLRMSNRPRFRRCRKRRLPRRGRHPQPSSPQSARRPDPTPQMDRPEELWAVQGDLRAPVGGTALRWASETAGGGTAPVLSDSGLRGKRIDGLRTRRKHRSFDGHDGSSLIWLSTAVAGVRPAAGG